jgi:hypothetical protein
MDSGGFQSLAEGAGPALNGVPVSLSKLLKPRAEGVKPSFDLQPTVWLGPGLAVHAS